MDDAASLILMTGRKQRHKRSRTGLRREAKPSFVKTGNAILGRFHDLHEGTELQVDPMPLVVFPWDVRHEDSNNSN